MRGDLSAYLGRLAVLYVALLIVGWLLGEPGAVLALGLTAYLVWTLSQARRMHEWLRHPERLPEPPESQGLWGDLFDGLYVLQRNHLRAQDRLQTMVNRVQESTNALRDGVIMTNAAGNMEWWNQSAENLLGFRSKSDRGQYIYNLLRSPEFRHYFDRKDYREPLELPSPAKPHIMLQIQINIFGDENRLVVVKDVTRIHHLEQMRRDFVSNVSHELRTPLTVINGYLETLLENADQLPPRWRRPLNTMSQQATRMEALITDLLMLSKLETSDPHSHNRQIDIGELLQTIVDDARAFSGERRHRIGLNLESHLQLMGDESQIRSAFSNIVFNAVKYTPEGGEVQIRWWDDRSGVHLAVRDSGIGIDQVHIPRLTERFYRADPSRHKDTGGTGLGLAIVKHVLINHDGRLEIHSEPGKGSEFICHFPRARALAAELASR